MKILIVSQYYYPEQFQINEIAPELVKHGHMVTVLTGLPNYPTGTVSKEYRRHKNRHEIIDGVEVIRCFEIGRKKGKLRLLLNYLSFALSASVKARSIKEKYDVVICYQLSPITMAYPAIVYKKKNNCPLLLYCLDIWPESAQAHVRSDKGVIYKFIGKISGNIYRKCDRILVSSAPFIDYLSEKHNIPNEKLAYLPQHADLEYLKLDLNEPDNGIADFMYAGNLGHGQVVHNIILAAAELKDLSDYRVHIVGDGSCAAYLKKLAVEKKVEDKVIFHGYKSRAEMPEMYKMADALLITLRGNNFVGNTLPGKLQVYMSTGKPIFGAINGAANDIINNVGCGVAVPSGDYIGLSKVMLDYINNSAKFTQCGIKAREYFKAHFTKEVFMHSLISQLNDIMEDKSEV